MKIKYQKYVKFYNSNSSVGPHRIGLPAYISESDVYWSFGGVGHRINGSWKYISFFKFALYGNSAAINTTKLVI